MYFPNVYIFLSWQVSDFFEFEMCDSILILLSAWEKKCNDLIGNSIVGHLALVLIDNNCK
jgi:hypothetical protein